ncbi:MAG: stage II sporulation protein P [Clostridia bacterium]
MQKWKTIRALYGQRVLVVLLVCAAGYGMGALWRVGNHGEQMPDAALAGRVQVILDLSQPEAPIMEKQQETEPEEHPDTDGELRIEVVERSRKAQEVPRVLIYHTHTYEAFEPTPDATYRPTERWRTKDERYNVVRLGEELAQTLRTVYGMEVVHDCTAHEPPVLSTAYTRSLETLDAYTARGETFDLYIDLHRNAYNDHMKNHNTVQVDGQPMARLMMLIGKGKDFMQKPHWPANLQLAQQLTELLNAQIEGLCYPVAIKIGRFNQHVSEHAILIEVGNNRNTLPEVLRTIPTLARAIAQAVAQFPSTGV